MGKTVAGLLIVVIVIVGALYYADQRLNQIYDTRYTRQHTVTHTHTQPKETPVLTTLNGTIRSIHGDEITRELWAGMKEYNVSDPRIQPYIQWLRWAFDDPDKALNVKWYPHYRYWWFDDRYGWKGDVPNSGIVRIGLISLPFGSGLVVTAFQNGNSVDIVIHGTIINQTGWLDLMSRVFFYIRDPFTSTSQNEQGELLYTSNYLRDLNLGLVNHTSGQLLKIKTDWVLWRVQFNGRGSELVSGNTSVKIGKIYVLLEMPAYWPSNHYHEKTEYWNSIEYAYWMVVGEPAFALAINLKYPEEFTKKPWVLYQNEITSIVNRVVSLGVEYPPSEFTDGIRGTVFMLRRHGMGVCSEQSRATTLLAVNALGGIVVDDYMSVEEEGVDHEISLLVLPSSSGTRSIFSIPLDVDGDGRHDTATVLSDTAGNSIQEIIDNSFWKIALVYPPLSYFDTEMTRDFISYVYDYGEGNHHILKTYKERVDNYSVLVYSTGIPLAIAELPDWLHTPWLNDLLEIPKFNITLKTLESKQKLPKILVRDGEYGLAMGAPVNDSEKLFDIIKTNLLPPQVHNYISPQTWVNTIKLLLQDMTGPEDLQPPSVALSLRKTLVWLPKSMQYS